jgi:hypothetical protein
MGHCDIHGIYVDETLPGCPMCRVSSPRFIVTQFTPTIPQGPGFFPGPWFVCPKCHGGFTEWDREASIFESRKCPWCGLKAGEATPGPKGGGVTSRRKARITISESKSPRTEGGR